jgi:hypothetical protein
MAPAGSPPNSSTSAATEPPYDYDQVTIDGAIRGIREGGRLRRQPEAAARKSAKLASTGRH